MKVGPNASKTCKICGKPVTKKPGPGRWPHFCSDECREEDDRRRPRKGRISKPRRRYSACLSCGSSDKDSAAKFCSEACRARMHRQARKADPDWRERRNAGARRRYGRRCPVWFIVCKYCEELSCVRAANATRCYKDECQRAYNREKMRQFNQEHKERTGKSWWAGEWRKTETCESCGEPCKGSICGACQRRVAAQAASEARRAAAQQRKTLVPIAWVPFTWLPLQHPAVRRDERPGDWWALFISGPCEWCKEPFTAAATHPRAAKYCSDTCSRYAANRRRGSFAIPRHERLAIYVRDGWICQLCFDPVDPNLLDDASHRMAPTLDHIECVSWSDEPDHSPNNLRLAHRSCNSARGDEGRWREGHLAA